MKKFVVIVAGGSGTRMDSTVPKQFLLLKGKPVLYYTIDAFLKAYHDIQVIVVLPEVHFSTGRGRTARWSWWRRADDSRRRIEQSQSRRGVWTTRGARSTGSTCRAGRSDDGRVELLYRSRARSTNAWCFAVGRRRSHCRWLANRTGIADHREPPG